jgi:branched-chain amino acid transport system ATP-binding protein
MSPAIEAHDIRKNFGGAVAVAGVTFTVQSHQIVGLIGPNGSGKTTTLNLLNGVYRSDHGTITVSGRRLTGGSPSAFVHAGVTRTFQQPRVFTTITAMENMLVPVLHHKGSRRTHVKRAGELLAFVGLEAHADTPASELSGGQQKLLEFVRALMTDPHVVLMDEPFAGVHPSVKELMRQRIRQRNADGTAFVIVSHEIPDLMRLCSEVICMADGAIVATGTPDAVTSDPAVVEAYLGRGPAGRGERG